MKTLSSCVCHLAVLVLAFFWTDSTSGFLVIWLGLALLLDKRVCRLLPWPDSGSWTRELSVRVGWFAIAALAFYFMRPGIVPPREAMYRGVLVSLVVFLAEVLVGLTGSRRMAWCVRLGLAGLLVLAVPLIAALHPLRTVPKRTPGSLDLAFEDVRFRTADDLELAGWLVPALNPRGNIIFCHGHGRNRGHVAGLLKTLHDLDLNVLAFDFRGHGDSPGHTSTFGHREVADLVAAEAFLRERCPGQPLLLMGISLGAAVSLQALPDLPNVRGVWSEGAFSRFVDVAESQFAWLPSRFRHPLMQTYFGLGWVESGLWGPAINPIERLNRTSVPIYFCHAQRDELVPLTEGQAICDAYAGPKWHWWVERASHYNIRQQNHEEYLRRLTDFLSACLPAASLNGQP